MDIKAYNDDHHSLDTTHGHGCQRERGDNGLFVTLVPKFSYSLA